MIDPHQKLIPALVHKNIANDFAINAYNFERNVQVNTFRPILRPSLLETTAREVQQKLNKGDEVAKRFISCVSIPSKMKVVQCQEGVEIRYEPCRRTVYTSGVTLMRRFEFEIHPVIEVSDAKNALVESSNDKFLTFTSTITIEAQ